MEFIIIVLLIVIIVLLTYLFLLNRELQRIEKQIDYVKESNSNVLIHSEYGLRRINCIINKINNLIKESKDIELDYDKKNKSLMKMMTNISHDLRTPLTSALGYVDIVLKSNMSEEEKKKELFIVGERLRRLEELINSFFEFSKVISNNESPKLEKLNINAVLEECIVHYYDDYKNDNREITLSNNKNNIIIDSNKTLLIRIFDNLIGNSYKHSKSNLDIRVIKKDKIKIIFTNELLNRDLDIDMMFNEFYTLDMSRTKGNTGLGLAIVKEFTEQLNGKIYAKKEKDMLKIVIEFLCD